MKTISIKPVSWPKKDIVNNMLNSVSGASRLDSRQFNHCGNCQALVEKPNTYCSAACFHQDTGVYDDFNLNFE